MGGVDGDRDGEGEDWRALARAETLLDIGRFPEAEQQFRALLVGDPESAPSMRGLARALLGQGRLVDAERAARRATDLDPTAAEGHHVAVDVYCAQDYGLAAVRHAERALALAPDDFTSHYQYARAMLLVPERRYVAEQAARHAVEVDPHRPEGQHLLGVCLEAQGRTPEARKAYKQALALDPTHTGAQNNLAVLAFERGRLGLSATLLRRAGTIDPRARVVHQNLDTVLFLLLSRVVLVLLGGLMVLGLAHVLSSLSDAARAALGALVLCCAAAQAVVVGRRLPRGMVGVAGLLSIGGWRAVVFLAADALLAAAVAFLAFAPEARVETFSVVVAAAALLLGPGVVAAAVAMMSPARSR
jgi:tetratricopeptide (TPR) repeat protein